MEMKLKKAKIIVPIYNDGYWYDYKDKILEGNVNDKKEFIAVSINKKPLKFNDINCFKEGEYKLI
jgi:hypothetical protein